MNNHLEKGVFFFKKWYFDARSEDGTFLFAYFAPMMLFGSESAELVLSIYPHDGGELRRSFHMKRSSLDLAPDHSRADFGAGSLSVSKSGARFSFLIGDTSLMLDYASLAPAWIPGAPAGGGPGVLLAMGKKRLCWTVPVPHAMVTGTATIAGRSIAIKGFGYHDFVLTDIPPWRLPLRELLWGRALGDKGAVIWNRPVFEIGGRRKAVEMGWIMDAKGVPRIVSNIEVRFITEQKHDETGGNYPSDIKLVMKGGDSDKYIVHLCNTRLLLGERVADVQRFRGEFERWLYRRFTHDPVEYKLLSAAEMSGLDHQITAAHEWILWGKR